MLLEKWNAFVRCGPEDIGLVSQIIEEIVGFRVFDALAKHVIFNQLPCCWAEPFKLFSLAPLLNSFQGNLFALSYSLIAIHRIFLTKRAIFIELSL